MCVTKQIAELMHVPYPQRPMTRTRALVTGGEDPLPGFSDLPTALSAVKVDSS